MATEVLGGLEKLNNRGVIEAITGTGKSLVGIAAIHEVVSYGGVALVIVPTRALVAQWTRDIRQRLPRVRVGEFSDGKKASSSDSDVVIATDKFRVSS